ncbi:MAG: hypothetical protein JWM27_4617 [Gemmatimonadetes bacterium]|nr:hypothetical protein [Gemmatimonadota bacterium]
MRRIAPAAALIALLAACNGASDVPQGPDTTGQWTGTTGAAAPSLTFAFGLQDDGSTLTGTGKVKGPGDSTAVTVSGTKRFRTVTLDFDAPGFTRLSFSGALSAAADSATGTLSGSGVSGAIVLRRTP